MNVNYKKSINYLKLKPKNNVAIIGSSICSCLLGDYLKSKFGVNVVFYEKSDYIGGAWRSDDNGNIFSNIVAPLTANEKIIFKKFLKFLSKKNIKYKKRKYKSYYANQFIDSYFVDFFNFYKKIKKEHKFRFLKVNTITENNKNVLINNKFKHDYVFFPNYIDLKKISKNSFPALTFKLPKLKKIKSRHVRIFFKKRIKDKLKIFFYSDKKFGPIDRLQIIKIRKNLFKLSGRVAIEFKKKSKSFLINNLVKFFDIKDIIRSNLNYYESMYYSQSDVKKISLINNNFNKIKHYDTESVLGFFKKYLL